MRTLCDERGVNSFKMFLAYKGLFQLDDTELYEAFEHCRDLGAVAQVHAENGSIIAKNVEKLLKAGVTGPEGHELSRNEEVEAEAVNRACIIAHQVSGGVEILCIYVGWKSYNFLFFFFISYFRFCLYVIPDLCIAHTKTHRLNWPHTTTTFYYCLIAPFFLHTTQPKTQIPTPSVLRGMSRAHFDNNGTTHCAKGGLSIVCGACDEQIGGH